MCDLYSKGISCVTIAKPWGGCGVTIGWLAIADLPSRQRIADLQYFGTACPSRASEIQAIMILRASDTILAKNMKIILHNKVLLDGFFEKYSDFFEWVRPNAGAIGFVRFKGSFSSEELGDKLAAAGISIKPAYCFCDDLIEQGCHDYDNYFRIGFGEQKMPAALKALEKFVEENKHTWGVSKKSKKN